VDQLIRAADIVSGLATLAGVLGWMAGVMVRIAFRHPVSFPDWILHAAGFGGVLGLLVAAVDVLT
jgi:hypothetical protein